MFAALACVDQPRLQARRAARSWIDDLTWAEVRDAIAAGKCTAIVFVGSSEQNGPHMAIGKHNFIARYCAERIAGELGDALVYPVIPFAITGDAAAKTAHMRFPGSVTLAAGRLLGRRARRRAERACRRLQARGADGRSWRRPGRDGARGAGARTRNRRKRRAACCYVGDLYGKADAQFDELLAKRGITSKELHAGIPDTSAIMFLGAENWIRKDQIAGRQ